MNAIYLSNNTLRIIIIIITRAAPSKKNNKTKLVPITLEVIDALSTSSEDISRKKREYPTAYICTYSVSDRESYEFAVNLIENLKIHAHAFHPIILASAKQIYKMILTNLKLNKYTLVNLLLNIKCNSLQHHH